ncbi:hypothetical protein [Nonomuraea sp. LPB2021202275-12-8]|uniref:hypothetical protein n=1 Tax=Nonomuraea sp. LPB2021202275-12-8 TaxID=3120159 RepID=UPI00300CAEB5
MRIALEAALPYEDEAQLRGLADRLEGQMLRISAPTHVFQARDELAKAIDDAMAVELEVGQVPDGALLAQVAYATPLALPIPIEHCSRSR